MLGMEVLRVAGIAAVANREAIAVCLSREERAIEAILKSFEDSCGVVAALNWWLLRRAFWSS